MRYRRFDTQVCVVDPEGSAFFEGWRSSDPGYRTGRGSRIEGIGRPRVEPSFIPTVVDAMVSVPDAASVAAMRWCSRVTGRLVGGSTGTALWGALRLVAAMRAAGTAGSVVTLLCDGGRAVHLDVLRRRLARRPGHRHRAVRRDAGDVLRDRHRVEPALPSP